MAVSNSRRVIAPLRVQQQSDNVGGPLHGRTYKWMHVMLTIAESVASLEWVTPGTATEGVIPLFIPEKPGDHF